MEELPSVLLAYRTTPQEKHQRITILLMFWGGSFNSNRSRFPSRRNVEFNAIKNDRLIRENLLFRDSVRIAAAQRDELYKRAAAPYHNAWICPSRIQVGDWVLRKNQVSHQEPNRKLDAVRKGPYQVQTVHRNDWYILTDNEE